MRERMRTIGVLAMLLALGGCKQTRIKQQRTPDRAQRESGAEQRQQALRELAAALPAPAQKEPTAQLATRLVALSLHCVDREYPNKPGDVQASAAEVLPPRKLHPAFYGCFDWHSAVHGHWTMARVLRRWPGNAAAAQIRETLDRHLTSEALAAELVYFQKSHHVLFERPYGWGWLLRLAAELRSFDDDADARRWSAALEPLARLLARRTTDYLRRLSVPVRAGTHANTAFALAHIYDYARVAGDKVLGRAVEAAARRYYLADSSCPVGYEPSGEDFISPCLAEADLMRRVLPAPQFRRWLSHFFPPMSGRQFAAVLRPPRVLDKKDPRIGHLIGLSLQRAWTMQGVASALAAGDARATLLRRASALHREDALGQMFSSGYGGAHWLASFAMFLLSGADLEVQHPRIWTDPVTGTRRELP